MAICKQGMTGMDGSISGKFMPGISSRVKNGQHNDLWADDFLDNDVREPM